MAEHYTRLEIPDDEHSHPDCGCRLQRDNDTGAVELYQCPLHTAAPDLLAACKAIAAWVPSAAPSEPGGLSVMDAIDIARAAIAKAGGAA